MAIKRIADVVNTHGLKGDLKIRIVTNNPVERFKSGSEVIINDLTYHSDRIFNQSGDYALLHLEEIDDISKAESLKGLSIYADVILKDDEFFYEDLIGLDVISTREDDLKIEDYKFILDRPYVQINRSLIPLVFGVYFTDLDFVARTIKLTSRGEELL